MTQAINKLYEYEGHKFEVEYSEKGFIVIRKEVQEWYVGIPYRGYPGYPWVSGNNLMNEEGGMYVRGQCHHTLRAALNWSCYSLLRPCKNLRDQTNDRKRKVEMEVFVYEHAYSRNEDR